MEAINSVLMQSQPVDEIIVVDDGSTDNTRELLKQYDKSIFYIWQRNKGPGAARNRGIREAKGSFLAFLDSDDIWVPDKIKIQMDFLKAHPYIDLVFADMADFVGSDDNCVPEIRNHQLHDYLVGSCSNLEHIFECLITHNVIPTPTVVIKRESVDKIGFFDEKLKIGEDLDYWLRATQVCRFGFLNAVLTKRRRHQNNLVNDWAQMNISLLEVLSRIRAHNYKLSHRAQSLLSRKIAETRYDLGSFFFKEGDFHRSFEQLRCAPPRSGLSYKWAFKLVTSYCLTLITRQRTEG